MPHFFGRTNYRVELRRQADTPDRGFRPGQLGALHAVLAHLSLQDDPCIISLPTGYGKTAVMMAMPFLLRAERVLIVEPSHALRRQTSSHFKELSTLRRIGVIGEDVPNPSVLQHEGRPRTLADWESLAEFDVVISTPGSSSPTLAPGAPGTLFDLVMFDEAHHLPADTWNSYIEHFSDSATFIFLTATPFRRDKRILPGKLVYRYPIVRAVEEEAFQPISFRAAPVARPLDDDHVDRMIAETAIAQLQDDRRSGFDHRLMARAATIASARKLAALYEQLGARVEMVNSSMTKRRQDAVEARLRNGDLDGVVCVDMFGEGYDFPKLKVAALHAPHRSLVPTIQFIGRFARIDATTGPATLIAPLSRIREATAELLADGVDLIRMLDAAAGAEIEGTEAAQTLLERLPVRIQRESDYEAVSPLTLELYAHAIVFHCSRPPDLTLLGETIGRSLRVAKQWLSTDATLTMALTVDENPPSWATADVLVNIRHDAFLIAYQATSQLCFIGSTRRTPKIYLSLMETVCKDAYRFLSYEETSRARAGLRNVKFYNVGLRNTTLNSRSESYRTMTGPQAERRLEGGDARGYVQGHYYGSGESDDERETIGASGSSKIWSNQRLTVGEYLDWIRKMDARLSGGSPMAASHLDLVRSTKTLTQLPQNVIAAMWPKQVFRTNPRVRFRLGAQAFQYLRLTDIELHAFESDPARRELFFKIVAEAFEVRMRFALGGGRMVTRVGSAPQVEVEDGLDHWTAIDDWLAASPPIFFSSDKSSFEGVNLVAPPILQTERLADGDTRTKDWDNCDITVEFDPRRPRDGTPVAGRRLTVQERLEEYLQSDNSIIALFYDHRTGEAADYIAVAERDGCIDVDLYHCKGAGGAPSGGRVGDVYELSGQLVKSVYYCDVITLLEHMGARMDARHAAPSYFCKGDLETVREMLETVSPTQLRFNVVAVQPGISRDQIGAHLADLMAYGINYVRQGGAAGAYWLVSA